MQPCCYFLFSQYIKFSSADSLETILKCASNLQLFIHIFCAKCSFILSLIVILSFFLVRQCLVYSLWNDRHLCAECQCLAKSTTVQNSVHPVCFTTVGLYVSELSDSRSVFLYPFYHFHLVLVLVLSSYTFATPRSEYSSAIMAN